MPTKKANARPLTTHQVGEFTSPQRREVIHQVKLDAGRFSFQNVCLPVAESFLDKDFAADERMNEGPESV